MSEPAYKAAFIALFCALTAIRIYYRVSTGNLAREYQVRSEGLVLIVSRSLLGTALAALIALYLWAPERVGWAFWALPHWLRVLGIVGGALALALLASAHRTLGPNFSTTVELRPHHRLVREGPYRWLRHPIYAAYAALFVCAFLISQNWTIGLSGLGIIVPLMTVRLVREERLLAEQFGTHYADYTHQTARFLPLPGTWRATVQRTARRWAPARLRSRD